MNNSICRSHKKTLYELVYGDKPCGNCSLIDELFSWGIYNEEDIPETIEIADFEDSVEDLDNDIEFNNGRNIYLLFIIFNSIINNIFFRSSSRYLYGNNINIKFFC